MDDKQPLLEKSLKTNSYGDDTHENVKSKQPPDRAYETQQTEAETIRINSLLFS